MTVGRTWTLVVTAIRNWHALVDQNDRLNTYKEKSIQNGIFSRNREMQPCGAAKTALIRHIALTNVGSDKVQHCSY